jgi:hypothetical protein
VSLYRIRECSSPRLITLSQVASDLHLIHGARKAPLKNCISLDKHKTETKKKKRKIAGSATIAAADCSQLLLILTSSSRKTICRATVSSGCDAKGIPLSARLSVKSVSLSIVFFISYFALPFSY